MPGRFAKARFVVPVNRNEVAQDWSSRGFSCELQIDPPGETRSDVVHRSDELITVIEGRLEIEVNRGRFVVEAGDELFIPRGAVHGVRNTGEDPARWLYGFG